MNFELSEDHELLRDGLRELLTRACDLKHVRAVAYDGDGRDPGLWGALAQAGWTALAVPEANGGASLGFEAVTVAAIEAGRTVLHLPLITTLLASRALAAALDSPARDSLLAAIAAGSATVTLGLPGAAGEVNASAAGLTATPAGNGWSLSGELPLVPYGPVATHALVAASLAGGGQGLFILETGAEGARWEEEGVMDRTVRRSYLRADGAPVDPVTAGAPAEDAISRLTDEWRIALAAENTGVCERLVELTAAYTKDRVQFGRPVGSNQAVKARVAEMLLATERMRVAVYRGTVAAEAGADDLPLQARVAKAASSAAGSWVASQAIHCYGGVGFTWEFDIHFFLKRAKSNELCLGDTPASLARVADLVL